jgi:beta-glucosidase
MVSHAARKRIFGVAVSALVVSGLVAITGAGSALPAQAAAAHRWMNPHQSPGKRATELLAAMSQSDKIALVTGTGSVNPALGIPNLGVTDGPSGLGDGKTSGTAFPAAENLAASFDTSLASAFGSALGQEAWGEGFGQVLGPTVNISRTPYWGREAETFGEDPFLSGQIAASEVKALQGQHVIATPKHFAGNNQDTDRFGIPPGGTAVNDVVSERALQEIYLPAFKAAVTQGGAESVMCAGNQVDGQYSCQNPYLLTQNLKEAWGFPGFVIPDTFSVRDEVTAFNAGLDTGITAAQLTEGLQSGAISESRLNDAVVRILTSRFATGQFDVANTGSPTADVSTPAHQDLATQISEEGSVLLQNNQQTLPLAPATKSIGVIGPAAVPTGEQVVEGGSSNVHPSEVITPLQGITSRAGAGVTINYAQGSLGDVPLTDVPSSVLTPSSGSGTGLTGTYYPTDNFTGPASTEVDPTVDFNLPAFSCPPILAGTCTPGPISSLIPVGLPLWSARWTGTLTPPETGDYRFSVLQSGGATLKINGQTLTSGENEDNAQIVGLGAPAAQQVFVHLTANQPVSIELDYTATEFTGTVQLGWETPSQSAPMIQQAVAAAAKSNVAIVFANQMSGEGMDRTSLDLPGDQDQLISAVAAANPNTIVVLNTPGPVLMPWLSQVKSVVEAWYPGQQDGQAIAALLFGDASFSGHLPVTWPASPSQGPGQTTVEYPGVNNTELYSEGIFVGYRYYQEFGQQPLYPFGYGLTYTSFNVRDVNVARDGHDTWTVRVQVTNTGARAGSQAVQFYVGDPRSTGEPPEQLKGFTRVTLQPGATATVKLQLTQADISYWNNGAWIAAPGTYTVSVGTSSSDLQTSTSLEIH